VFTLPLDIVVWAFSLTLGTLIRFQFNGDDVRIGGVLIIAAFAALLQTVFGIGFNLYRERSRVATFDELQSLALTAICVGMFVSAAALFIGPAISVPRGSALIAVPIFVFLSGGIRAGMRIVQGVPERSHSLQNALVYGAGSIADLLIPQLRSDSKSRYVPVGLIDDDIRKKRLWIDNVPVLGTWNDLEVIHRRTNAEVVIVCIAHVDSEFLSRIEADCRVLDLKVILLPSLTEVVQGRTGPSDLKDLTIEDIVGRRAIDIHIDDISSYISGKRVLVTGAGGSIGSELCRQISNLFPERLVMLDRDESGLQLAQIDVSGNGLLDSDDLVLVDIRDEEALHRVFLTERPDVVFHAAALKHLPVLERFPDEAWKTNVLGTLNVLSAARGTGVSTFVNISTDKAADPSSVLGASKKLAEGLTSWFGQQTSAKFLSVRFGNVLGSRGSIIPTFAKLIERGGPITITHPEVTRYFMTIEEACQLVLQAGASGNAQDVLVLDMGKPVKILDIAAKMIEASGKKIDVVYTGLRSGEKLHEDLFGSNEIGEFVHYNLISKSYASPVAPAELDRRLFP
jgi:dTDP-glucose 4,6-dehydratase